MNRALPSPRALSPGVRHPDASKSDGRPKAPKTGGKVKLFGKDERADQTESVDRVVEQLCEQGCRVVYQRIEQLRAGVLVAEARGLTFRQRERVLAELESIMAVYAENGSTCLVGPSVDDGDRR